MTFTYKEGVDDELPDLAGFDVEATDGHIGKIVEATYETGRACFLVDTGHWIFGALRLIPAGVVTRIDVDQRTVSISMSKEQVKHAPDHDEERHRAGDETYRSDVIAPYYDFYTMGPTNI